MNEFALEGEEGEKQMKTIGDLYLRERERKSQNNASASGIGRQSPY